MCSNHWALATLWMRKIRKQVRERVWDRVLWQSVHLQDWMQHRRHSTPGLGLRERDQGMGGQENLPEPGERWTEPSRKSRIGAGLCRLTEQSLREKDVSKSLGPVRHKCVGACGRRYRKTPEHLATTCSASWRLRKFRDKICILERGTWLLWRE